MVVLRREDDNRGVATCCHGGRAGTEVRPSLRRVPQHIGYLLRSSVLHAGVATVKYTRRDRGPGH